MRDPERRERARASARRRTEQRAADPVAREAWRDYMRRRYADPVKGAHDRMKRRARRLKRSATKAVVIVSATEAGGSR
jgi:hypothetical protein